MLAYILVVTRMEICYGHTAMQKQEILQSIISQDLAVFTEYQNGIWKLQAREIHEKT